MIMVCMLCMIWVWVWDVWEVWFIFKQIGIVGKDVDGNVLYCFKMWRLTLGIGNFMSSYSLSAGHVPLGLGHDTFTFYQFFFFTVVLPIFFPVSIFLSLSLSLLSSKQSPPSLSPLLYQAVPIITSTTLANITSPSSLLFTLAAYLPSSHWSTASIPHLSLLLASITITASHSLGLRHLHPWPFSISTIIFLFFTLDIISICSSSFSFRC